MGTRIAWVAVLVLAAGVACGGDGDGASAPIVVGGDREPVTLSGVTFEPPAGWSACRFPGNVIPGPTIEVRPPGSSPETSAPLSVMVAEDVDSYGENLDMDELFNDAGEGSTWVEKPAEVPGAREATAVTLTTTGFGYEYAGRILYVLGPGDVFVKVTLTASPETVDGFEPAFRDAVESLAFDTGEPDTDLSDCTVPAPPTPRPRPEDTEDVPEEIAGTYEMTLSDEQLEDAPHLDPDERTHWVLTLQGDVFELTGSTDTGTTKFEIPILEASPSVLVLEGSSCDNPLEAQPVTVSLSLDGDDVRIEHVDTCDPKFEQILTLNLWERT